MNVRVFHLKIFFIVIALILFSLPIIQDVNSFRILIGAKENAKYMIETTIPKEFLNIPKEIIYEDIDCLNYEEVNRTTCVGGYSYNSIQSKIKRVKISINYDKNTILYNLIHEIGHTVYYNYLNESERDIYNNFWTNTTGVTKYGNTRPSEDFAEYFAILNYHDLNFNHKLKLKHEDKRREKFILNIFDKYPETDIRGKIATLKE